MARKNPNGYGGIVKLSGNRKKPYMAYVSEMITEGLITQPSYKKALKTKTEALQSIDNDTEMLDFVVSLLNNRDIEELKQIAKFILNQDEKKMFKVIQKKKAIGYYPTYKEAQIALAEWNSSPYDLANKKLTFEAVWNIVYPSLHLDTLSPSSKHRYIWGYEQCRPLHKMPVVDIRTLHLQQIIDKFSDKSYATQVKPLSAMKAVFDYAIKNDIVDKDYSQYVKVHHKQAQKPKTALTKEEVQLLWDNVDYIHTVSRESLLDGIPIAQILLVLVYTGMRIRELLNVQCSHVHLDANYIEVMGTKTDNAKRIVPIHYRIKPIIEKNLNNESNYLFHLKDGSTIEYSNFYTFCFKKFCDTFGYDHTIHEHRHTFATYSALCMDSKARAFIIGHKMGITDDRYTHPEMIVDILTEEINKFDV